MAIQAFADEMKGRAELMGRQTQDVAKAYLEVNRRAYGVCFGNAQTLARAGLENGRKFYDAAFERFAAARTAGMHELALLPVAMAPEGRDTLIATYREVCDHAVKTRSELLGVLREGFRDIRDAWIGERAEVRTGTAAGKAKTVAGKTPTAGPEARTVAARKSPAAARRKTPTAKRAAGTKGKGSARVKSADGDAGEPRQAGTKS